VREVLGKGPAEEPVSVGGASDAAAAASADTAPAGE